MYRDGKWGVGTQLFSTTGANFTDASEKCPGQTSSSSSSTQQGHIQHTNLRAVAIAVPVTAVGVLALVLLWTRLRGRKKDGNDTDSFHSKVVPPNGGGDESTLNLTPFLLPPSSSEQSTIDNPRHLAIRGMKGDTMREVSQTSDTPLTGSALALGLSNAVGSSSRDMVDTTRASVHNRNESEQANHSQLDADSNQPNPAPLARRVTEEGSVALLPPPYTYVERPTSSSSVVTEATEAGTEIRQ